MTSLRDKINKRFEEIYRQDPGRWVIKEAVCEFAKRNGYSSENAGRRLRELESGILSNGKTMKPALEVRYRIGDKGQKLAYYRLKSEALPPKPPQYKQIIRDGELIAIQV